MAAIAEQNLHTTYAPIFQGDRLIIQGEIGGHIYESFTRDARLLKNVRVVELNSYGGSFEWAVRIAEKIHEMKVTTVLPRDHVCASSCLLLYAAGVEREADAETWFGLHGVRLGNGLVVTFSKACISQEGQYDLQSPRCAAFLAKWEPATDESTGNYFAFLEANGVSKNLRQLYYNLPDDPDWMVDANLFRKPDYVVTAAEAYYFSLVTHLNSPIVTSYNLDQ